MTIWHPDICDCRLFHDDATGKLVAFAVERRTKKKVRIITFVDEDGTAEENVREQVFELVDYLPLGPDTEKLGKVLRCVWHKSATPEEIGREAQAKERTREAIRVELALADAPDWQRGKDGGHEIILPEGLTKAQRDRVDAKVAQVGDARLTKVTTLSEIAAKVRV